MNIYPLFSGSSGNSTYVEFSKGRGFLVDAGKSAKQIEKHLKICGVEPQSVESIFVTHEHLDHVSGLKVFASRYNIKVYGSRGTVEALKAKGIVGNFDFEVIDKEVDTGYIGVNTFKISHDCSEGTGYVFSNSVGEKFAVCTDLGYVSDEVKLAISGCEVLMLESNHDVKMVENGPYPYYLKKRILSNRGHLSNETCAQLLPYLVNKGTKKILLSHLSSNNNIPELAIQTSICELGKHEIRNNRDVFLDVAPKLNESGVQVNI